jgi:hypothetical protein
MNGANLHRIIFKGQDKDYLMTLAKSRLFSNGLLKNAHLRRCLARSLSRGRAKTSLLIRRDATLRIASLTGRDKPRAPCIWAFLSSLQQMTFSETC